MENFDDVIINKTESIRKCVDRAREEYIADRDSFLTNFSRQDAAILNIQRGCEQAINLANHVVRLLKLGVPNDARDTFYILARKNLISFDLSEKMGEMIGFRNSVVHEYQKINMKIVVSVIEKDANDLLEFGEIIRKQQKKIQIFGELANIDFNQGSDVEEKLIKLIEELFDYHLSTSGKVSEIVNLWRRLSIIGAISAAKGVPEMTRFCAEKLRQFFLEEKDIFLQYSKDLERMKKEYDEMSDEDIVKDIAVLQKRFQN